MIVRSYFEKHKISFSECNYWGEVTAQKYLCMFENARFNIGKESKLDAFFYKEHRGKSLVDESLNDTGENFIMPVLQSKLEFQNELKVGTEVYIYSWLDMPKGVYCSFNHKVTSLDSKTVYAKGKTSIGIVGNKSGLMTEIPKSMRKLLLAYIADMNVDENHVLLEV